MTPRPSAYRASTPRSRDLGDVAVERAHRHYHPAWRTLAGALGLFAVVAVVVSRVLSKEGSGDANSFLTLGAALIGPIVVGAVILRIVHAGDRLVVRARGLSQTRAKREVSFAFEDVVASRTRFAAGGGLAQLDVRLIDDSRVVVHLPARDLAVAAAIVRPLSAHHLARAREAFDQGRSMCFGTLEVDGARGLACDNDTLPWSSVADVTSADGLIVVRERGRGGGTKDWWGTPLSSVEDIDGLFAAVHVARALSMKDADGTKTADVDVKALLADFARRFPGIFAKG
jgi:hypothetical protein